MWYQFVKKPVLTYNTIFYWKFFAVFQPYVFLLTKNWNEIQTHCLKFKCCLISIDFSSNFYVFMIIKQYLSITFVYCFPLFRGCRQNKAPFELFSLDTLVPIDNYLNYSQVIQHNDVINLQNLAIYVILTSSS